MRWRPMFGACALAASAAAGANDHEALGTVLFPVSCAAAVRPDFNRAVALLHHMTYPQARARSSRSRRSIRNARWRTGASG